MERTVTGFDQDEVADPVALLDCGHRQHVRHEPPFINRPWVTTEEGRNSMLGTRLNCVRCDHSELPDHFVAYKQTPVFTESTLPDGLKKNHSTRNGVWAKIRVAEGRLRYRVESLGIDTELTPDVTGIVIPEVLHSVEPLGNVRFLVEFYKTPDHA